MVGGIENLAVIRISATDGCSTVVLSVDGLDVIGLDHRVVGGIQSTFNTVSVILLRRPAGKSG